MQPGRLTFACELDRERLAALFAGTCVSADLAALEAHVCLMLSDFSPERTAVVRQLNAAQQVRLASTWQTPATLFGASSVPRSFTVIDHLDRLGGLVDIAERRQVGGDCVGGVDAGDVCASPRL
jgi:hypothetical protein